MARRFFYACAGLFLLAVSYHLGARNAGAQSGAAVAAISTDPNCPGLFGITGNGELYWRRLDSCGGPPVLGPPVFLGNYLDGAVNVQPQSFGQVKVHYR